MGAAAKAMGVPQSRRLSSRAGGPRAESKSDNLATGMHANKKIRSKIVHNGWYRNVGALLGKNKKNVTYVVYVICVIYVIHVNSTKTKCDDNEMRSRKDVRRVIRFLSSRAGLIYMPLAHGRCSATRTSLAGHSGDLNIQ